MIGLRIGQKELSPRNECWVWLLLCLALFIAGLTVPLIPHQTVEAAVRGAFFGLTGVSILPMAGLWWTR